MTEAVNCMNAKFYFDTHTTGTTATWTEIKELKSYPSIGKGTIKKLDATHLGSTMTESIEDVPECPELELTFNAMPYGATDSNLNQVMTLDDTKAYPVKLELPKLGIVATFTADWTWNVGAGAVSQVQELTISLAARSAITISQLTQ